MSDKLKGLLDEIAGSLDLYEAPKPRPGTVPGARRVSAATLRRFEPPPLVGVPKVKACSKCKLTLAAVKFAALHAERSEWTGRIVNGLREHSFVGCGGRFLPLTEAEKAEYETHGSLTAKL